MGKTHKLEKARALYHSGQPHKNVELIGTGETYMNGDPRYIDNGGQRWGNQRKMRAKMKVDARKSERMKNKKIDFD